MAIKDLVPAGKTVVAFVVGAALAAGVTFAVVGGVVEKKFVPSEETCDVYIETRNDRFICGIYGTVEPVPAVKAELTK